MDCVQPSPITHTTPIQTSKSGLWLQPHTPEARLPLRADGCMVSNGVSGMECIGGACLMWEEQLAIYDAVVGKCPRFERKGKTVPYTSANGHMFSLLNKDAELGFRYSKQVQEKYLEEWGTTLFKSHGATMRGYTIDP